MMNVTGILFYKNSHNYQNYLPQINTTLSSIVFNA